MQLGPWAVMKQFTVMPTYIGPNAGCRPRTQKTFNSEDQVRILKKNFQPFSKGPCDCAGRSIALLELSLVFARTLWKTDIRLAPGATVGEGRPGLGWGQRNRNQYIYKDSYLVFKDGPELQFQPRLQE